MGHGACHGGLQGVVMIWAGGGRLVPAGGDQLPVVGAVGHLQEALEGPAVAADCPALVAGPPVEKLPQRPAFQPSCMNPSMSPRC